ncbi:MAG TPA: T9SS type A sorting domain-containing protein [Flavobacteriales bacterium]|nr:T9SS type A sorting domain-containing protein [Flavobacteriales bacterium]
MFQTLCSRCSRLIQIHQMLAEIRFTTPDYTEVSLTVHNMIGALIISKRIYSESGMNKVILGAGDLKPGVYIVTLSDGKNTSTKRMVVSTN